MFAAAGVKKFRSGNRPEKRNFPLKSYASRTILQHLIAHVWHGERGPFFEPMVHFLIQ